MLGSDLLVAPVLRADDTIDVSLPDDEWVDFWTGERVQGPTTLHREVPLDSMPLFVRAESVLPMAADEAPRTIKELSDDRSLRVTLSTAGASRAQGEVYDPAAEELREVVVACDEDRTALDIQLPDSDWLTVVRVTVDGLETRPESVVVNGRTIPTGEPDANHQGWTYADGSGTVTIGL
jgi:alpha-D-xyloside xylohydrolase